MKSPKDIENLGLLDFHTHSVHSDGGDTPTELVKRAKEAGVSALALTDHNVTSGLEEFRFACEQEDILAIPFGTEIHAELPKYVLQEGDNEAPDFIILGRDARPEVLRGYHSVLLKDRIKRFVPDTLSKLVDLGFYIPKVDVAEQLKDVAVPSIFHEFVYAEGNMEVLVDYIMNVDPAVTRKEIEEQPIRFVNRHLYAIGKPAYFQRLKGFGLSDAISLANEMKCKIFVAHPGGEYGYLSEEVLNYCIQEGVHGIETRSYFNTSEQNELFDRLVKTHELMRSGGSDCHGDKGPFKIGMYDRPQNQVPKEILKELWNNLS